MQGDNLWVDYSLSGETPLPPSAGGGGTSGLQADIPDPPVEMAEGGDDAAPEEEDPFFKLAGRVQCLEGKWSFDDIDLSVFVDGSLALSVTIADFTFSKTVFKDTVPPAISEPLIVPENKVHSTLDTLSFQVKFEGNVYVQNGTPSLSITLDNGTKEAFYIGGSESDYLSFSYQIVRGDNTGSGISIGSTQIVSNGASILDGAGNAFNFSDSFTVPNLSGVQVDGLDVTITGIAARAAGIHKAGDSVTLVATFSSPVTMEGTKLMLDINGIPVVAELSSGGAAGVSHEFMYTVVAGHNARDGEISATGVEVPAEDNASLIASNANEVARACASCTVSGLAVDTMQPTVSSISSTPTDGTYDSGQQLNFDVELSEDITVRGTPQLHLNIGSTTRHALFTGLSGTRTLQFSYTVKEDEKDSDGISLGNSNKLAANGSIIADMAGNTFSFSTNTLTSPANLNRVLVDATYIGVSTVVANNLGPHKENVDIDLVVTFNRAVTLNNAILQLSINGASATSHAKTASTAATAHTFVYSVGSNHNASAGQVQVNEITGTVTSQ